MSLFNIESLPRETGFSYVGGYSLSEVKKNGGDGNGGSVFICQVLFLIESP